MQKPASRTSAASVPPRQAKVTNQSQQVGGVAGPRGPASRGAPSLPNRAGTERQLSSTTTSALAQSLVGGLLRQRPATGGDPPPATPPSTAKHRGGARGSLPIEICTRPHRSRPETRAQLLERLNNPLISLQEASIILRVCPGTVRRYTNAGILRHVRTTGGQRRFYFKDVLELSRQEDARRHH